MKMFTLLLEEKLLFKILQWAGIGMGRANQDISQELMISKTKHWYVLYVHSMRVKPLNITSPMMLWLYL